jgi:alginate O-acetyltransferase complex protein AlgI
LDLTALLFLAAALGAVVVHWLLPAKLRSAFLALGSFAAVTWLEPVTSLTLLFIALTFYIGTPRGPSAPRRISPTILVVGIIAYLLAFKYIPPILGAIRGTLTESDFIVPLGISYFTFKLIHYAVETSLGEIREHSLSEFLAWVYLFPIYTAGPIERFDHYLVSRESRFRAEDIVAGLTRIVHGIVKKFAIGSWIGHTFAHLGGPDIAANLAGTSPGVVWAVCATRFLFLYIDFSAYSDLAIGASRLFGIRIAENFHWPILGTSIGGFWQGWHKTLSGWCRSYVYLPMIGLFRNPYVAVYASFVAIGLWHSGTLNSLFWGLYHGTGIFVQQLFRRSMRRRGIDLSRFVAWRIFGWAATMTFVSSSFAFAVTKRDGPVLDGLRVFAKLFGVDL